MTTPQDSTNTTERAPRSSGSPPDEPRRATGPEGQSTMPPRRTWLWFALICSRTSSCSGTSSPAPKRPSRCPTPSSRSRSGGQRRGDLQPGGHRRGPFEEPVTYPPRGGGSEPGSEPRTSEMFTTALPSFVDPGLEELLIVNGVEISAEPIQEGGGWWQTLLFGFGPALLLIGGYVWLYRRAAAAGRRRGRRPHGRRPEPRQALRPGERARGSRSRTSPA